MMMMGQSGGRAAWRPDEGRSLARWGMHAVCARCADTRVGKPRGSGMLLRRWDVAALSFAYVSVLMIQGCKSRRANGLTGSEQKEGGLLS